MYDIALRPTNINGTRYKHDYIVVWKSDCGQRRVGRIRRAEGSGLALWVFQACASFRLSCQPLPMEARRCRRTNSYKYFAFS
jgi:hypothetical protein